MACRITWFRGLLGAVLLMCSLAVDAASLERLITPGPVSAAHAEIENSCGSCHAPLEDKSQATLCTQCHEDVGEDLSSQRGFHGLHPQVSSQECQSCHTEHEGRNVETLKFDLVGFDHKQTDFALLGAHAALECVACHEQSLKHRDAPSTCVMCHAEDDPHRRSLGGDCASCHNESDWLASGFNHAATGFLLQGGHAQVSCESCHADATFAGAPTECVACHSKDDAHDGSFGRACEQCHSLGRWKVAAFDHAARTGFALVGGHTALSCAACHGEQQLTALAGGSCGSCHAKDDLHDGVFGGACESCHTAQNWAANQFEHHADTGFELLGAHAQLACSDCHAKSAARASGTDCASCHIDPHENQLGGACETCHGTLSFQRQLSFDHDLTGFPLLGEHASVSCVQCHASSRFHDANETCASCHVKDDVHAARLGTNCGDCHNPAGWALTSFDHGAAVQFPLRGAHQGLRCEACHSREVLMRAVSAGDCVQCHRGDDPHQGRFGKDCARCHDSDSFSQIRRF